MTRKLSVVLTSYVRRLGSVGDVVSVAPGYARHFLVPRGFARIATKNILSSIELHKKFFLQKKEENLKTAQSLVKKFEGRFLSFVASCSQSGDLYGSISSRDIKKKISQILDCPVQELTLDMDFPIKNTGFFSYPCHIGEVCFDVPVIVGVSDTDIEKIRDNFLSQEQQKNHRQGD